MAIQGIEGVVQQLQATAVQAGALRQNDPVQGASFANELKAALGKISETQQTARQQAQNFELGVPGNQFERRDGRSAEVFGVFATGSAGA
ncbi:Flagellar hook-basal body complex protein FliE [Serratia fonticola]|uniref:Flagellar hook-basal body complex protein FliE n=1 Tax=Serratia fonticola TaxID=47917 RepID=A0A4U9VAU0_SERFO|nr:Flagellar hook-basal body complex protein FliE [Serratia fonticola]